MSPRPQVRLVLVIAAVMQIHTSSLSAVNSALDRIQVFQPGLSVSLVCREPCPDPTLDPNGGIVAFDTGLQNINERLDALGARYTSDGPSQFCAVSRYATTGRFWRMQTSGVAQLLLTFPGECDATTYIEHAIADMYVDSVNGRAFMKVGTWERDLATTNAIDSFSEVIEVSGLPRVLDLIPRGSETKPKANRRDGKDNDCNGVVDR